MLNSAESRPGSPLSRGRAEDYGAFGPALHVPIRDLRAGPEQHVLLLPDLLEDLAEIFGPVRRAHDVGVHRNRHHPGGALGVLVDLLELVHRPLVELRGLVMLDQHHGDVVAFLRVGNVEDRLAARLQPHRLVVEHPVGDIVVAFLGQDIRRLPGFGQAGAEPAARALAGRLLAAPRRSCGCRRARSRPSACCAGCSRGRRIPSCARRKP